MKRAREAYPDKYAAAVARKKARSSPAVRAEVSRQLAAVSDKKYTDVTIGYTQIPAAGIVYSGTNNLVRGNAGIDNFVGNNIVPQGFQMKYFFNTNNQTFAICRVLCVQWFDASVPTISGLLQNTATTAGVLSAPLVTNKSQMRVLYDKTHAFAPTSGDGVTPGQGTVFGSFYIPGSRLRKMKFNSTTNTLQDGGIYTLLVSDDAVATYPLAAFYSRLAFIDA